MSIRIDPVIIAARIALVGTFVTAAATVAAAYVKPSDEPKSIAQSTTGQFTGIDCISALRRLDAYIGSDQKRIDILEAKGPDGITPLQRDTSAQQCSIGPSTLKSILNIELG
jgi:hypothetical protein